MELQPRRSDGSERKDPETTTTIGSASELLREVSRNRGRVVMPVMLVLLVLFSPVAFHARAEWLTYTVLVAFAVDGACFYAIYWLSGQPDKFSQEAVARIAFVVALATIPLLMLFGTESMFTGMVIVALLVHTVDAPARFALRTTSVLGSAHALLDLALNLDWFEAPGLSEIAYPMEERTPILNFFGILVIYALCYLTGQSFRQRLEIASAALETAVAEIAGRNALLREARRELEEAVGLGGHGRFTGLSIGSFTLGVVLGRGGMGEIYAAEQLLSDGTTRPAAVKLLRFRGELRSATVERFLREVEVAKSIKSPHIVETYEVGDLGASLPYIGMERLEGADLAAVLRDEGTLTLDEVREMSDQIADGLSAAHASGVVHRDIKPSNLFRCTSGVWKVLDFGVARLASYEATQAGLLVGTPAYMAPEQVADASRVDHRADVHAMAAVIYRALTGAPPIDLDGVAECIHALTHELPRRPSSLASIPTELDVVLRIGLAKSPSERFDSVRELADALHAAAERNLDPALLERARRLDAALTWGTRARLESPGPEHARQTLADDSMA